MIMKYAVVTGGTKGIGLGIVLKLLERGYFVITNYVSDDFAAELAEKKMGEISSFFIVIKANQDDKVSFRLFVERIRAIAGKVDLIVCNAGMTLRKPTMKVLDVEWEQMMQVCVNSHFYLIRDLYDMIPNNSRIIFIGSMMGVLPHATSLPYGVTKSAIHALAKNLVKEFEGTGTTVNAIAPGFVETEWQKNKPQEIRNNICKKTALGRFATVDEIVSTVMFCMDNPFVNGSVIEVNGGYCFK